MTTWAEARHVEHLIVGAGFAGLCAAIKLQEDGETDFLVVEKGSDVGGTWRDNTYPGAACDVPSQLYSFSFAPNPEWTSSFSPQPEIQAYIRRTAERSGVLDRFVFDTALEDAAWDESTQRWTSRTSAGTVVSRTLVVGAGGLSEPRLPDIAGIDDFGGELFHSARWDHDVDLAGKRIAVIGTGASAIQIIPELQKVAGHVDVYQRTAPYVIPRNDRTYTRVERALFKKAPALQKAYRTGIYWSKELLVPGFTFEPRMAMPAKQLALANLRKGVSDPDLRARLTPTFEIGCKRILISNAYYPAIASDNVELVTDRIERITPTGVVTADGVERPVDVVVVATGFFTTELPIAQRIHGQGGATLADTWREDGMAAHKGTTVHGFPNLFMIVGPNTGLGHSSMVFVIESQVEYIRSAVRTLRHGKHAAVSPKASAQRRWNDRLQRRMKRTVWTRGGCASWYLDEHGKNTVLWPRTTVSFRRSLAEFDVTEYDVTAPVTAGTTEGISA
ncbi:NAD(P)/FAD-dependent oxidoreductase [Nocardioides sp. KIGAM211]|uniref:NAD(P)/FAD-dependent oxidoreductase n=1 Tax=Nocardioides luti TaxID=2761101 RepID=A0A7X0RGW7_9ACTN|nr:NAD(P)/FAD-dependent oxidoreductase [Nocardioides luti]MBB6627110.1 NAD(P)/FAD-dependent oxidoreductase [Nocardioides luti]